MSLESGISAQQRALGDLQRARKSTSAWADDQRRKLDAQRLDALETAGREVLAVLTEVSRLAKSADQLLKD